MPRPFSGCAARPSDLSVTGWNTNSTRLQTGRGALPDFQVIETWDGPTLRGGFFSCSLPQSRITDSLGNSISPATQFLLLLQQLPPLSTRTRSSRFPMCALRAQGRWVLTVDEHSGSRAGTTPSWFPEALNVDSRACACVSATFTCTCRPQGIKSSNLSEARPPPLLPGRVLRLLPQARHGTESLTDGASERAFCRAAAHRQTASRSERGELRGCLRPLWWRRQRT